ncbi:MULTISPECIES: GNAT family N-acetyltransferase [unclassified Methylobacterium]|jgi:GNAT superfamily N-acetyltransferase|uniref:GNAT family N-acetyltransferase n=1 Tax=unclassified Methylobacterium TaxID=2615210 RepID=UPI00135440CE|nr:GNAT family N-acetyltransferase [Methylobacterium sp. 2A]MWV24101.1 GNAT family N-acetyltransferase [Methylobacterium sp. 2A]
MAVLARDEPTRTVRRLWRADRDAVLDYFLRLDPETRASRFMGNVSEAGVRAYAAQAVTADGIMYGAFVDGVLRGLGELRPMGPCPSRYVLGPRAEAAFAVERAFRRRGLGADLFARIARAARHRGVVDLHVRCLSGNGPMLRLAAKHGAALQYAGSEIDAALHLERPTPFSLWYEGIAEAFDFSLAVGFPSRSGTAA